MPGPHSRDFDLIVLGWGHASVGFNSSRGLWSVPRTSQPHFNSETGESFKESVEEDLFGGNG